MNNIKKKPIRNLTLAECYELANQGYIFIKYKNIVIEVVDNGHKLYVK